MADRNSLDHLEGLPFQLEGMKPECPPVDQKALDLSFELLKRSMSKVEDEAPQVMLVAVLCVLI